MCPDDHFIVYAQNLEWVGSLQMQAVIHECYLISNTRAVITLQTAKSTGD